ncbi:DUF4159 domain-containing protein [Frigidibacter sp. ROC022]|uniref:DUF4159 domain-containing protein n=1 Tax=Frigidibacter sp. ROC022 TaxID=2971796 RepID=UPI00215AFC92|nr:DUF4159 domain-containing protein [Frigidibacter sp. ROC022]MCR8722790.1 DUF4159 domain-containing protein [Frigidibacter sp. ROC022]
MWMLGPIGFTAPWLLLGLIVLPVLWLLLRAVPPAPVRRLFPGVVLLFGLKDEEHEADKTPWWLLLLRMLAVAAVIVGFAGPVLNPDRTQEGQGPLLILADGTWADAADWQRRIERIGVALDEAARAGRPAAVVSLTDLPEGPLPFQAAEAWTQRLPGLTPHPWAPSPEALAAWIKGWEPGSFDSLWLSDGLAHPGREDLLAALEARGTVRVFESPRPVAVLLPPLFKDGAIALTARRSRTAGAAEVTVSAQGPGPNGVEAELSRVTFGFEDGKSEASIDLSLPPELRNRITRFEIVGLRSAGAVSLTDDTLKRREVALIAGSEDREGLELLSPTHYLEQALAPTADLIHGTLGDVILANPDAIILADVATLAEGEAGPLLDWVERGGLLIRFAGPRLAASSVSRETEDPLMPVRLRVGGRSVGGAMSWGEPKALAPFPENSPFAGLPVPEDVTVTSQVMAQPDPQLSSRVIAELADGTPLVTRKEVGLGQVVLFHVTANAEWSTLPLSGLFVQMLERLAVSSRPQRPSSEELAGTTWVPEEVIDAFGRIKDAGTLPGIPGEELAVAEAGPATPPGLYAGEDRRLALNVAGAGIELTPTAWPARIVVEGLAVARTLPLKGWLLALALALLALDAVASLALGGRLRGARGLTTALMLGLLLPGLAGPARAQDAAADAFAIEATSRVVLAHVITGDKKLDDLAQAGLLGLSETLFARTSVEPGLPIGVDLETDELSFFPFLYWPISPDQKTPSSEAYAKLNRYLRAGGMILFDTRDGDVAGFGSSTPEGRKLKVLAAPLDIPPLEPIPADHVLTRTFYLLQDFPGRFQSRDVWVEAAPPDAEQVEGMPFRNLNDGVTPVVIGGNDWASAWAVDSRGAPLVPIGRGFAGERQREMAKRFGVNLIMHVLTGNYKSDQVHVPALLERLGQ